MAIDTDTRPKNEAEEDYQRKFGGIADNFSQTADPTQEDSAIKRARKLDSQETDAVTPDTDIDSKDSDYRQKVAEAEETAGGRQWQNNTNKKTRPVSFRRRSTLFLKKYGPTMGMAGLIMGGFGGISLLLAPASLMAFLDRQMTSDASDSTRTNIIMRRAYIGGMINKADCSSKIKCKFSTMSEAQVDQWRKNGFAVEPDKPDADGNKRYKVTSVTFPDGTKVTSSKDFFAHVDTDIHARAAFDRVVNVRSSFFNSPFGNYDKTWRKYGIDRSRTPQVSTSNDDETRRAENNRNFDQHTGAEVDGDTDARARAHLNNLLDGEDGRPGLRSKVSAAAGKIGGLKGASVFDATSMICTAYTAIKTTVALIKAKWYKDLIVYGAPFFQVFAKIINQGSLQWQEVEYVGDRLTWYLTESIKQVKADLYKDYSDEEFNLTAMDSQGIKAMIYGEHSALKEFTKQYMGWYASAAVIGGGLAGSLESLVGGKQNLKDICFASNAAGLVMSAGCISNPGAFLVCAAAVGAAALFGDDILETVVTNLAEPAMRRIAEANLNSNLAGVRLGNALAAMIGLFLMEHSRASGLRPAVAIAQLLHFTQATEDVYQKNTTELAKYEASKEPFNPANQYSFISQLSMAITPYMPAQNGTLFNGMANMFATVLSPLRLATPIAGAQLHQPSQLGLQAEGRVNMCNPPGGEPQDQDLADIGVLCDHVGDTAGYTDPLTVQAIQETVNGDRNFLVEVADYMYTNGYIDEDGRAIGDKNPDGAEGDEEKDEPEYEYVKYENYCGLNRPASDPPGTTTKDLTTGSETDRAWWIYARCAGNDSNGESLLAAKDTDEGSSVRLAQSNNNNGESAFAKMLRMFEAYYNACKTQAPIGDQIKDCVADQAAPTSAAVPCNQGWTYPTDKGATTFTSGFGARWGAQHNGVDLAGPIGTPIYAACDGKVVAAGAASGFGQWVVIDHDIDGDGKVDAGTVYGHIDTFSVKAGDTVKAGQPIATIGNRGESTGPHLHFEIYEGGGRLSGGTAVDPAPRLGLGSPSG